MGASRARRGVAAPQIWHAGCWGRAWVRRGRGGWSATPRGAGRQRQQGVRHSTKQVVLCCCGAASERARAGGGGARVPPSCRRSVAPRVPLAALCPDWFSPSRRCETCEVVGEGRQKKRTEASCECHCLMWPSGSQLPGRLLPLVAYLDGVTGSKAASFFWGSLHSHCLAIVSAICNYIWYS